jgi:DNA-3-methyladenine glycosylase II
MGESFTLLVRAIIAQQISGKAATTISQRVCDNVCGGAITPAALVQCADEQLRAAGVSTGKQKSLRDLARRVHEGELDLDELERLDDEAVIAQLIPVHGIGRWTAQMFLIFTLGRLDVLPVDDLGFRAGVEREYQLKGTPSRLDYEELAEPWRPYRSIATWYLWRSLDAG